MHTTQTSGEHDTCEPRLPRSSDFAGFPSNLRSVTNMQLPSLDVMRSLRRGASEPAHSMFPLSRTAVRPAMRPNTAPDTSPVPPG